MRALGRGLRAGAHLAEPLKGSSARSQRRGTEKPPCRAGAPQTLSKVVLPAATPSLLGPRKPQCQGKWQWAGDRGQLRGSSSPSTWMPPREANRPSPELPSGSLPCPQQPGSAPGKVLRRAGRKASGDPGMMEGQALSQEALVKTGTEGPGLPQGLTGKGMGALAHRCWRGWLWWHLCLLCLSPTA